jgi:hypothetical protein
VQNPIRLGFVVAAMTAFAVPSFGQAQENGHVTKAALTVSETVGHARQQSWSAAETQHPRKSERTAKTEKRSHRPGATARGHTRVSKAAVPRSTFEDRTAHYFDPLSLTVQPENRLDPAKSEYDQVTDSFTPPDKALVARTPDDAASTQISSASIEQMGKGNNHTVVVPLFQILNSLSPGSAEQ